MTPESEVISIERLEDFKRLADHLEPAGYTWSSGKSLSMSDEVERGVEKYNEFCVRINHHTKFLYYADRDYYVESGYYIHTCDEYLLKHYEDANLNHMVIEAIKKVQNGC